MTNADKIRQMTDDELCDFLKRVNCFSLWCKHSCIDTCSLEINCGYCRLQWLKEEVKET